MHNFQQYLQDNEQILYQGKPSPGKGSKGIGGIAFLILFALSIQIVLIWSVVTKTGDGAYGITLNFIIIFLTATIFLGLGIYGLIYNLVLKEKQVADDFYCLTNIRALKYEAKKDKLVYGYLSNYEEIYCYNVKDNHGDLYFGIIMSEEGSNDTVQTLSTIKDLMMNPDPENMPCLYFESIENPNKIMRLAKQARINILQSRDK